MDVQKFAFKCRLTTCFLVCSLPVVILSSAFYLVTLIVVFVAWLLLSIFCLNFLSHLFYPAHWFVTFPTAFEEESIDFAAGGERRMVKK